MDWSGELTDQLQWHWANALRPRLEGLTDEEYLWEPVDDVWTLRPRARAVGEPYGGGDWVIDFSFPPPDPAPVTTIAWRLAHIVVGVLGLRCDAHFGVDGDRTPYSYDTFEYAATADEALAQLDHEHDRWVAGVRSLDASALAQPAGPAEAPFDDLSMATLVLHINREVIHHGAEIALLRDLYLRRERRGGTAV